MMVDEIKERNKYSYLGLSDVLKSYSKTNIRELNITLLISLEKEYYMGENFKSIMRDLKSLFNKKTIIYCDDQNKQIEFTIKKLSLLVGDALNQHMFYFKHCLQYFKDNNVYKEESIPQEIGDSFEKISIIEGIEEGKQWFKDNIDAINLFSDGQLITKNFEISDDITTIFPETDTTPALEYVCYNHYYKDSELYSEIIKHLYNIIKLSNGSVEGSYKHEANYFYKRLITRDHEEILERPDVKDFFIKQSLKYLIDETIPAIMRIREGNSFDLYFYGKPPEHFTIYNSKKVIKNSKLNDYIKNNLKEIRQYTQILLRQNEGDHKIEDKALVEQMNQMQDTIKKINEEFSKKEQTEIEEKETKVYNSNFIFEQENANDFCNIIVPKLEWNSNDKQIELQTILKDIINIKSENKKTQNQEEFSGILRESKLTQNITKEELSSITLMETVCNESSEPLLVDNTVTLVHFSGEITRAEDIKKIDNDVIKNTGISNKSSTSYDDTHKYDDTLHITPIPKTEIIALLDIPDNKLSNSPFKTLLEKIQCYCNYNRDLTDSEKNIKKMVEDIDSKIISLRESSGEDNTKNILIDINKMINKFLNYLSINEQEFILDINNCLYKNIYCNEDNTFFTVNEYLLDIFEEKTADYFIKNIEKKACMIISQQKQKEEQKKATEEMILLYKQLQETVYKPKDDYELLLSNISNALIDKSNQKYYNYEIYDIFNADLNKCLKYLYKKDDIEHLNTKNLPKKILIKNISNILNEANKHVIYTIKDNNKVLMKNNEKINEKNISLIIEIIKNFYLFNYSGPQDISGILNGLSKNIDHDNNIVKGLLKENTTLFMSINMQISSLTLNHIITIFDSLKIIGYKKCDLDGCKLDFDGLFKHVELKLNKMNESEYKNILETKLCNIFDKIGYKKFDRLLSIEIAENKSSSNKQMIF